MYVERNSEPDQSQIRPRLSFMGIMNGVKMYDSTPEYMGEELEKRATKVAEFFCGMQIELRKLSLPMLLRQIPSFMGDQERNRMRVGLDGINILWFVEL